MTHQCEFEVKYKRPKSLDAVRNSGKTFTFRADPRLTKAIDQATEATGFRFTSEFIRAAIIASIERVIRES